MLGQLISAFAGRAVARQIGGRSAGPLGAVAGAALPFVLRRFGPLGMVGALVGSYAIERLGDRRAGSTADGRLPPPR